MGFFRKLFSPTPEDEVDESSRRPEEESAEGRRRIESWFAAAPCPTHGSTSLTTMLMHPRHYGPIFAYGDEEKTLNFIRVSRSLLATSRTPIFIVCHACGRISGAFVANISPPPPWLKGGSIRSDGEP